MSTCCIKWNKTPTFICSTLRQCGARSTIRVNNIYETSVNTHITGKISVANLTYTSTTGRLNAGSGMLEMRQRLMLMVVN